MKLYSFAFLQEELEKRGVRHNRPYLNMLEQLGILPKSKYQYISRFSPSLGSKESRVYTEQEIQRFARIVEKFTAQNRRLRDYTARH